MSSSLKTVLRGSTRLWQMDHVHPFYSIISDNTPERKISVLAEHLEGHPNVRKPMP